MIDASYKKIAVKTWHLQYMGLVPELNETYKAEHWINPCNDDYLSLYKRVGECWGWTGRLLLTPESLSEKLNSQANEVWLFNIGGIVRGFFEIDRSEKGKAEIVYFGLLPEMIGKGFGKIFLETAIAIASGVNGDNVWLHTCEYDHPKALEIYLKAGFVVEKETIEQEYYLMTFLQNRKL
jgi:GNAT superfamily N-acetyltransferase